jgi:hypothetical protein
VTVTVVPLSLGVKMSSRVEAPVRHDEAILDYSPATRSYRYTIDGGLPVADNRTALRSSPPATAPRSSGSRASRPWTRLEAEVSRLWAGTLATVLGNLKTLIEGAGDR